MLRMVCYPICLNAMVVRDDSQRLLVGLCSTVLGKCVVASKEFAGFGSILVSGPVPGYALRGFYYLFQTVPAASGKTTNHTPHQLDLA